MSLSPIRPRRWFRRLTWILAIVVVVALTGPFVFIHYIEGSAPAELNLPTSGSSPSVTSTTSASSGTAGASSMPFAGTWNIGANSIVGYRVNEVLIGQSTTAVGRSEKVWGSLRITGTTVDEGEFTVDMATVKSDQSERNAQFDGPIMDVSQYPTASLRLTSQIDVGSVPALGRIATYSATGELFMHGVTKSVTFRVSVERTTSNLDVLADIPISFSKWNIANPSVGGFVTTANNGTLEALPYLTKGAGNPVSTQGVSSSGSVGTPVTVPPTTVPPLKIK